jgi:transglutaminase-like putative cysteine protease
MKSRRQAAGVIATAFVAGLCFRPVFGYAALLVPVGAVCVVAYGITEIGRGRPQLSSLRPLLIALVGLLAVVETVLRSTTVMGLPTMETVESLGRGLESWRLTLESTWPARPEPDLVLFVPLLVLLACLLGLELLDRSRPLVAVLPSIAVLGVSQAYVALTGFEALLTAAAYAAAVATLLVPSMHHEARDRRGRSPGSAVAAAAVLTVAAVGGGIALGSVDPIGRTPYTFQQGQSAGLPARLTSPLDEIAGRLADGSNAPVFRYQSSGPVDRWRLVALDDFDGANWTTTHPFLRLGTELAPSPGVRVPTTRQQASVEIANLAGPWLPSQLLPTSVAGVVEPQVEPIGGTLLVTDRPDTYMLTWSKPTLDAKRLLAAGVDTEATGGLGDLGAVPTEIASLAEEALAGRRATFQTALALEGYLRDHYKLASGDQLPTGHSWPQLQRFLVDDKVGTSEQFAASYVALARLSGIPARLVVGFRAPVEPDPDGWYTVRNSDVLAWPEIAVQGVGWWPLDPAGQAQKGKPVVPGSDSEVTEQARAELPPSNKIEDPILPEEQPDSTADPAWGGIDVPARAFLVVVGGLVALWVLGVPLLKMARARRRRRRTGSAAVVGAWAEARDRLRAHGVPVTAGMTVRDLAAASTEVTDERARRGLVQVAGAVDQALWSGAPAGVELSRQAWVGVREVRAGLRARPWSDRLRATWELRTLLRP